MCFCYFPEFIFYHFFGILNLVIFLQLKYYVCINNWYLEHATPLTFVDFKSTSSCLIELQFIYLQKVGDINSLWNLHVYYVFLRGCNYI